MENLRKIRNEIDICIYHGLGCMDGFSGFWIAQHYLKNVVKKEVIGIPKAIDDTPIDENLYTGKNVLMIDILTKDYKTILAKAKKLVILDHHKSSKEFLESDPNYTNYAYFNMVKSGAGLAWEYFFEVKGEYYERYNRKEAEGYNKNSKSNIFKREEYDNPEDGFQQIPDFLAYIQDRDLYTFKLERSKDFNEGLYNWLFAYAGNDIDKKIQRFNELYNDEVPSIEHSYCCCPNDRISLNQKIIDMGGVMNLVKNNKIEMMAKNTQVYQIKCYIDDGKMIKNATYKVAITECSHDLASDLGHYLVENKEGIDFAMLWRYDHTSEQYWYSLRSDDNHADVSAVCKIYKGGGHRNASGMASLLHPKDLFSYVKLSQ